MTITYEFEGNLYINLTNQCPNACDFCIRTEGDSIGGNDSLWLEREPTLEEIKADIDGRDLSKYDQAVFCGFGEPTCRLDVLLQTAKYIRSISPIKIRINTNGQSDLIWGRKTAGELKGLIDIVSISLNASDADKYDAVCHSKYGKAAFDAMLDFTREVQAFVPSVTMSVVDSIGEEEIERCRAVCEKTGAQFRVRELI